MVAASFRWPYAAAPAADVATQAVLLMSMGGRLGRKLLGHIPVTVVYLVNILYGMAVLANLLGCLWLFIARCEGTETSWLMDVGVCLPTRTLLQPGSNFPSFQAEHYLWSMVPGRLKQLHILRTLGCSMKASCPTSRRPTVRR